MADPFDYEVDPFEVEGVEPSDPVKRSSVSDIFSGADRMTPAMENTPEAFEMGIGSILGDIPIAKKAALTGVLMTTYDDDEFFNILQANASEPMARQWDEKGNAIYAVGGENQQRKFIVNRPGVSPQDLMQMGATGALFTPAGIAKGTGVKAALGVAGKSAATESVAQGAQAASGGDFNPVDVAIAGGSGLIFQSIAGALAKRVPALRSTDDLLQSQESRRVVRDELLKIGFDDVPDKMVDDILKQAADSISPQGVAPLAGEKEFGIALTKGGRLMDDSQIRWEDAARQGVYGERAKRVMLEFDDAVRQQVDDAVQARRVALGGEQASKKAGGEVVRDAVAEAEDAAYSAYTEYLGDIGDAYLDAPSMHKLFNAARKSVIGIEKDRSLPETAKILDLVNGMQKSMVTLQGTGAKLKGTHWKQIEMLRKRIGTGIRSAEKADRAQLIGMQRAFDDYVDTAVVNGLFSGDEAAISQLKQSREIFSRYAAKFRQNPTRYRGGKPLPDPVGKFVEKVVAQNPTGEEVMNALLGAKNLNRQGGARLAERILEILGPDSEGWQSIRQEAFGRLLKTNTLNGKEILSGQKSLTALNEAIRDNESLMRTLFSSEELGTMRRFFAQVQRTRPQVEKSMQNPSGSGIFNANMLRGLANMLGLATGDLTATIGSSGVEMASGLRSATKAASSVRPFQQVISAKPAISASGQALIHERQAVTGRL